MKLSEHFDLAEFTASDTAARRGIDNTLPDNLIPTAQATAQMLERIRAELGGLPVTVTSGYRCQALNAAIGSSSTSDHPKAMAVDFKCPAYGSPYEVARNLAPLLDMLGIGQLIHEYGQWVHVSTRIPDKIINRVITISSAGTQAGVQRA